MSIVPLNFENTQETIEPIEEVNIVWTTNTTTKDGTEPEDESFEELMKGCM